MRAADRFRRGGARACLAAALALCVSAPGAHADSARTSHALRAALRDPGTWIPAVAALVVSLSGRDHAVSSRAAERMPVFRTHESAIESSDALREGSYLAMVATMPLVPGAESSSKTLGETLLAEHAGLVVASGVTWVLKRSTGRERPDGSNSHSFPSGHATRAFAARGAFAYNLDQSTLATPARVGANATLSLLAAGAAWARVEGGVHHASDVLAGAAIGNFFGRFFAEALVPEVEDEGLSAPHRPGGFPGVTLTVRF